MARLGLFAIVPHRVINPDSERGEAMSLPEEVATPATPASGIADAGPFAGVEGRDSVDYLLRNTQQQLVALGGQAEFKASVMITASSIVASIAASQIGDHDLRWGAVALMVLLVPALLTAVLTVYPKFRLRKGVSSAELPRRLQPIVLR